MHIEICTYTYVYIRFLFIYFMYTHSSIYAIYVITTCTIALYIFFEARENDFGFNDRITTPLTIGFIRPDVSA